MTLKLHTRILAGVVILALLQALASSAARATSAQGQTFTFAAVQNNAIVTISSDGSAAPVATPAHRSITGMAWSPDGSLLAFIMTDEDWEARLMVTGTGINAPMQLNTGVLEGGFGVAFTPDGLLLYVGQGEFPTEPTAPYLARLMQIAPAADAQPVELGRFGLTVGCGGGSPIPADWQYWTEAGFGGTHLTLQWTPFGIVHSTACSGGEAALFDPATGTSPPLGPTEADAAATGIGSLSRLTVAPDETRAVGVRRVIAGIELVTSLAAVDLASGSVTDLPALEQPDQVAWLDDSTVLYSTRALAGDLLLPLTAEQRATVASAFGFPDDAASMGVNAYRVSIRVYSLTTGEDREVFGGAAYAIGRMRALADGSVLFSQIANLERYIEALLSGYDPLADADGAQARALVPISVYRLDVSNGTSVLVGEGLEQMTVRE